MTNSIIGIFGGTFDPIHHGHLQCALYVQQHCQLTQLRLMPSHLPPHRETPGVSAEHRAAMVELAIKPYPQLALERLELEQQRPSYTADSLLQLKQRYHHSTLAFVIGMDSLCYLTRWYHWQQILQSAHLLVCRRPGYSQQQGDAPLLLQQYGTDDLSLLSRKSAGHIMLLDNPLQNISATGLRQQLADPASQPATISHAVLNYIRQHKLYQGQTL
ncbi:nicotinate-nucleotide adenylyltransferase [Chromatiaceae bacterium AAb-1]|jgi:nicotinate-nucleotide adenylyltransferase|nr:nicotinate-nucleotide adenylyltransferase [Chromatiaceae bacterium AAb-1]